MRNIVSVVWKVLVVIIAVTMVLSFVPYLFLR